MRSEPRRERSGASGQAGPGEVSVSLPRVRDGRLLGSAPCAALTVALTAALNALAADPIPVAIRVDAAKPVGELRPIWRFFGADEPNYAYMKDGQKLLAELGELKPKAVYFRTHNLKPSGHGSPALKRGSTGYYREDKDGKPVYNWTIVDRIFDTYLRRGVRPYVQIGFMPKDLSIKPDPY